MGWRVVLIETPCKLAYKNNYMLIRSDKDNLIYIPEIDLLMINTTQVVFTGVLLAELVKNKVKIIFTDEKHNPNAEIISLYGTHNSSRKIYINNKIGDFEFDDIVNIENILKFLSLKPQMEKGLACDNIINYISLSNILSAYKLMVFINARAFFSINEIKEFIKIAKYKEIKLLFLENKFYNDDIVNKVQIDEDYFVKKFN